MLLFKTEHLRALQAFIQPIKSNKEQFPVLAYLKFQWEAGSDYCTITKTNLKTFVVKRLPLQNNQTESGALLVSEDMLNNFILFSNNETINITHLGKQVKLRSGKANILHQLEPVEHFPSVATCEEDDAVPINLEYARLVAQIINNDEIPHPTNHVFLGPNGTCGGDGVVMFKQPSATYSKKLSLRGDVIRSLPNIEFKHAETSSYDFFFGTDLIYGFVKAELAWVDFDRFFKSTATGGFQCDKAALLRFNNLAVSAAQNSREVSATWGNVYDDINSTISLEMKEAAYNIDLYDELKIIGDGFKFSYLPLMLSKLLNAIPYETLNIIKDGMMSYIKTADGAVSLITSLKIKEPEPVAVAAVDELPFSDDEPF